MCACVHKDFSRMVREGSSLLGAVYTLIKGACMEIIYIIIDIIGKSKAAAKLIMDPI